MVIVDLGRGPDNELRRLRIYPEGGSLQERKVPGIGWVNADEEVWGIDEGRVAAIREAAKDMCAPLATNQAEKEGVGLATLGDEKDVVEIDVYLETGFTVPVKKGATEA